jgi:urease gamma subunit
VNCPITIQSFSDKLMISTSSAAEDHKQRGQSMVLFKKEIESLLMSYLNDKACDGRLLYDLASSAGGNYVLKKTESGAVRQQGIKKGGALVWMQQDATH